MSNWILLLYFCQSLYSLCNIFFYPFQWYFLLEVEVSLPSDCEILFDIQNSNLSPKPEDSLLGPFRNISVPFKLESHSEEFALTSIDSEGAYKKFKF